MALSPAEAGAAIACVDKAASGEGESAGARLELMHVTNGVLCLNKVRESDAHVDYCLVHDESIMKCFQNDDEIEIKKPPVLTDITAWNVTCTQSSS